MLQYIIPAAASLIGGLMNSNTASENNAANLAQRNQEFQANERQLAIQNEARLRDEAFRAEQYAYSKEQNIHNEAVQREFAQSGIQWRVQDAIKAGLHPLAALGGSGASFSGPTASVGSIGPAPGRSSSPIAHQSGGGMGSAVSAMGQDISRAMQASASQDTRLAIMNDQLQGLGLERAKLTNDLLKAQLASLLTRSMSGQQGPPVPSPEPDRPTPFPVPESPKVEPRPPLMFGGRRWNTNPDTSPMKAWEDQYGDEGPVASMLPIFILWNDFMANYGQPATWPKQIVNAGARAVVGEFNSENFGNPRVSKPLGRR